MVELQNLENRRQMLIRKYNDKSAKIFAMLGSVSLPLLFFGLWVRLMGIVEVEDPHPVVEAMNPLFLAVGSFMMALGVVSLLLMLFFYIKYDMLFYCIKNYVTTVLKAIGIGASVFLIGALFTGGFTIVFYGFAIVFFPVIFVPKYYKRIEEELLQLEQAMGVSPRESGVRTVQTAANQQFNKWEALFAPIRNEPLNEMPFVEPMTDPTKGWYVDWGGDFVDNYMQYEIKNKIRINYYVEIQETDGKILDFQVKRALFSQEGEVEEITDKFLRYNPIREMQFIQLSPLLAVLIYTNTEQYSKKKIWKLVKEFPNAPDPRTLDKEVYDMESAVLEKDFLNGLNSDYFSTETQVLLLALFRDYRRDLWMYKRTGHTEMGQKANDRKESIDEIIKE